MLQNCQWEVVDLQNLMTEILHELLQVYRDIPNCRILACAPQNAAADLVTQRLLDHVDKSDILRLNAPSRSYNDIPPEVCYVWHLCIRLRNEWCTIVCCFKKSSTWNYALLFIFCKTHKMLCLSYIPEYNCDFEFDSMAQGGHATIRVAPQQENFTCVKGNFWWFYRVFHIQPKFYNMTIFMLFLVNLHEHGVHLST